MAQESWKHSEWWERHSFKVELKACPLCLHVVRVLLLALLAFLLYANFFFCCHSAIGAVTFYCESFHVTTESGCTFSQGCPLFYFCLFLQKYLIPNFYSLFQFMYFFSVIVKPITPFSLGKSGYSESATTWIEISSVLLYILLGTPNH